ncbi:MAG: MoaD/ThiS family protein [Thermoproteota archaeon]
MKVKGKIRIEIKYYAWLREKIEVREVLEIERDSTVRQIIEMLRNRHTGLKEEEFIIAVNNKIVNMDEVLRHGDLIIVFPPAGGG